MKKKTLAIIMSVILAFSIFGSSFAYSYLSGSDSEQSSVSVDASLIRT